MGKSSGVGTSNKITGCASHGGNVPTLDATMHDGYGCRMVYSGPDYIRNHRYRPRMECDDHVVGVGDISKETSHDAKFLWRNKEGESPFLDYYEPIGSQDDYSKMHKMTDPKCPIRLGEFRDQAEFKCHIVKDLGWYPPGEHSLASAVSLYREKVTTKK